MEHQTPNDIKVDIAKDYFIAKWPDWLRWVVMVPAALLGCFIVSMLLKLLMSFGDRGDSNSWRIWVDIVQSFIFGLSLVAIAAYSAPKKQLTVAIIFTAIACILGGMLILINLQYSTGRGDMLYGLMHSGLFIAGAISGNFLVKSEIDDQS